MTRLKSSAPLLFAATAFVLVMAWPTHASAQRRHVRGPAVRSVVVVGGGFYPRFFYYDPLFYDPWYQWRPYGPYAPYGPYGYYGYGRFDSFAADVRVEVSPREAEVFVDGYSAGTVDDFDGIFQRLRIAPGAHEITIYLAGYRTIRLNRYFRPGSNDKIRATMEPLAPGESAEAPPQPSPAPVDRQGAPPRRYEPDRGPDRAPEAAPARFGTLSLRVLPGDADLLVDGEKWPAPAGQDRTAIKLPEGRHRIEIQKDGYAKYVEEILIRRDQTLTLNVSLVRR